MTAINTASAKKYFVLKISETIGEYEASAKVLVHVQPENLEQHVDDLLLTGWRGEAEYNYDDEVYENGEVSWYKTSETEIDDSVAQYLIEKGVMNLL